MDSGHRPQLELCNCSKLAVRDRTGEEICNAPLVQAKYGGERAFATVHPGLAKELRR